MKQKSVYIIMMLWLSSFFMMGDVYANELVTSIKLGRFSPEATRSDLIYGLEFSNAIDKYLEFGVSVDYFANKHSEETRVNTLISGSGTVIDQKQVSLETKTQYVPILANLKLKLPLRDPRIIPYASAGLGYCWLWDQYTNYVDDVEDTMRFNGMVWRIALGSEFTLGRYSSIACEGFYNHAKPSHEEDVKAGLPIRTEVDMSGAGFNVQFKLKY